MFSAAFLFSPAEPQKVKEMLDATGKGYVKRPKKGGRPLGLRVGGLPPRLSGFPPPQKVEGYAVERHVPNEIFENHKYYNHGRPEKKNPAIEQR